MGSTYPRYSIHQVYSKLPSITTIPDGISCTLRDVEMDSQIVFFFLDVRLECMLESVKCLFLSALRFLISWPIDDI